MSTGKHAYLVQRAARWLRGTRRCAVVATEKNCQHVPLIPDAIGWTRDGFSILVECKLSRSDFLADRRKWAAQAGAVIGDERWYLTPKGLLRATDMPDGVGLAEVHGNQIRRIVEAACRPRSLAERAETIILAHVAWHAIGHHFGRPPAMTRHDRPEDLAPVSFIATDNGELFEEPDHA